MISRMMLLAGVAGTILSLGAPMANAAVTDTNTLTTWENATGDSTPLSIAAGMTLPPSVGTNNVTFGGATSNGSINPAGAAEASFRPTYWNNGWADHGTGAIASDNVIKLGTQSNVANSVTFNVTGLIALGLFMQVNGTGSYSIFTCTLPNGRACSVDPSQTAQGITDSGTAASTGGVFFGYYGDPLGGVESIVIQLNPAANDSSSTSQLVVGQFYEVSSAVTPVPEPATLGLVGFGLAALGLVRRRKHG